MQRVTGWLVLIGLVVGGGGIGCGKKKVETGPAIGGVEGGVVGGGMGGAPVGEGGCPARGSAASMVSVELIDAGAEPRAPLRFLPTVGRQGAFRMRMEMDMDMSMSIGGEPISFPIPAIPAFFFDIQTEVISVESDGVFCTSTEFVDIQIDAADGGDPMMVSALEQSFTGIIGLKGYGLSSATGAILALTYGRVEDPLIQQQLDQFSTSSQNLSTPMPEEPVGVGARWAVENQVDANGLRLLQRTVYTLAERKGDEVVINAEITQRLDPSQSAALPGLPAGAQADISRLASSGSGQMRLDLNEVAPLDSAVRVHLDMAADIAVEGQNASMGMAMDMEISTQPLP